MSAQTATPRRKAGALVSVFALELILLAIIGFLCMFARGFATWDNFLNILRNASTTGIIAFGMTFVIIAGEIDLGVGSAIAFNGCLLAVITEKLTARGHGAVPVILLGIAACFAIAILTGHWPQQRAMLAIQPQMWDWGEQPTPAVAAAIAPVTGKILELLRAWNHAA